MLWMAMDLVLQNKEKEKEKNKQVCPVNSTQNCFEVNTEKLNFFSAFQHSEGFILEIALILYLHG